MRIIDLEEWLTEQGADSFAFSEPGMHNPAGHMPRSTWNRYLKEQEKRGAELTERREALRIEYASLIEAGQLRPRTRQEKMIRAARGNMDNASVQAARRICLKNNWDWQLTNDSESI